MAAKLGSTDVSFRLGATTPAKVYLGSQEVWAPTPTDPDFANVSLLLHMDGADESTTFTDSSANAVTVTANGGAEISTAESKFGGASGYFDGVDSSIEASVSLGETGDFTCECWFRAESIAESGIVNQGNSDSFGNFAVALSPTGQIYLYASNDVRIMSDAETVEAGEWYHLALCRQGTTTTLFLNGTSIGSTSTALAFTGTPFKVGNGFGGIAFFSGYVDDLRITTGVARYTANFTPPTAAFPDA